MNQRVKQVASELEDHLGYWLRLASNHVSQAFQRKVEERGVTVAEWVVLRVLFEAEAMHPSALAERLGMTRGAVSKLVERLLRKKLADRTFAADDRRFQTITLTPTGKRLMPQLARLADANEREFFGHLPAGEVADLVRRLRALATRHGWRHPPTE